MTIWKKTLIALGFVGSIGLSVFACGGTSFSCDEKGQCPNDVAPAKAEIDACNMPLKDPTCGAKFEAASACEEEQKPTCGADGRTQRVESAACKMQHDAYASCQYSEALDGGGGG